MIDNHGDQSLPVLELGGRTGRESIFSLVAAEKRFVEGRDLRADDEPGLARQLWFEKIPNEDRYLMHGKVRLGYSLGTVDESGDVEWIVPLTESDTDMIFNLATERKLPVQKHSKDVKFSRGLVLDTSEEILLSHLSHTSEDGPILRIATDSAEVTHEAPNEKTVWIVPEKQWSEGHVLNLLAEAIEYTEEAKTWESTTMPFRDFRTLTAILSDSIYERDLIAEVWRIDPVRDRHEYAAFNEWLKTLRNWGNNRGHYGWGERLVARTSQLRTVVREDTRRILMEVGVTQADLESESITSRIDMAIQAYEMYGRPRSIHMEAILAAGIMDEDKKRDADWSEGWEQASRAAYAEMRALWARDILRSPDISTRDGATVARAAQIIYEHAEIRTPKLHSRELAEFFRSRFTDESWRQRNPNTLPLRDVKRLMKAYFTQYDSTDSDWNRNIVTTVLEQWLNSRGVRGFLGAEGHTSRLRAVYERSRSADSPSGILAEWKHVLGELRDAARIQWRSSHIQAARTSMHEYLSRNVMLSKMQEADKVLPDMNDVWRLWKRERARLLQRWVQPNRIALARFLLHSRVMKSDYVTSGGIQSLSFDSDQHQQIIERTSSTLSRAIVRLRALTADLGMPTPSTVDEFLTQLGYQGEVTQKYGHEGTFSLVGAQWREKLAHAAQA